MTRVIFVNGFNRSGTTLITTAATEACGATTLTVGHLARHMPTLDEFLTVSRGQDTVPDRGVDRLPATESMPEEYGWLLNYQTGAFTFSAEAAESGVLHNLVEEVADDGKAPVVVLKNPWDTGQEQLLLDSFPDSRVLLVRRELRAIEDSLGRAWARMATSNQYIQALLGNPDFADMILGIIRDPEARQEQVAASRDKMRRDLAQLLGSIATLPLDRVAFLSYDELRRDPKAGAAWAAHVLDPDEFANAIAAHTFPEYNSAELSSPEADPLDQEWADAWQRARERQIEAGILPAG